MNGPHRLTASNVDSTVQSRTGVYLLYNSRGGPVRYVGMSSDLEDRLQDWTGHYGYFKYEYQSSQTAAYRREAGLYHYHGGKESLDNEKHPPRPHRQVKCPSCGIHE
jgi:hypothetical protein